MRIGKLGAVVGSAAMAPVLNKWGLDIGKKGIPLFS